MSNTLDANLNVISENEAIEIQMLDGDISFISKLDDEPNDVGGMTSAQLKAEFDRAGNVIKNYLNEKLVPAVLAADATEIARTAAENERANNEVQRVAAENLRASAETARDTAEQSRAEAEQARVDETAGVVAQATEQAVNAAGSAESARGSAQAASRSAGNAATSETNAKTSETNAAESSSAAKASASNAKASETAAETAEAGAKAAQAAAEAAAQEAKAAASGDYLERSIYDPQGKKTDIFAYVEEHGGVQPDWNQNDDTQPDYVKNRTHWAIPSWRLCKTYDGRDFENIQLSCSDGHYSLADNAIGGVNDGIETGGLDSFVHGITYRVVYDDEIYERVSYLIMSEDYPDEISSIRIGNHLDGDPFEIAVGWEYNNAHFSAYDSDGNFETGEVTHTLSIYVASEEVHKLDAKYLPESKFVIDTHFTFDGDGNVVACGRTGLTIAQIDEAYNAGLQLILRVERYFYTTIQYYNIPLASRVAEAGEDYDFDRVYTFECDDFAVRIVPADASEPEGEATIERVRRGAVASEDEMYEAIEAAIGAAIGGSY